MQKIMFFYCFIEFYVRFRPVLYHVFYLDSLFWHIYICLLPTFQFPIYVIYTKIRISRTMHFSWDVQSERCLYAAVTSVKHREHTHIVIGKYNPNF